AYGGSYGRSDGGSFCRTVAEYVAGGTRTVSAAGARTLRLRSGRKREHRTMKAVLYTAYGQPDVLQLREIDKPSPKENEVLVRVHASSINAIEWRRFTLPLVARIFGKGIRAPRNMSIGGDLAGRVEAVGANVKQF